MWVFGGGEWDWREIGCGTSVVSGNEAAGRVRGGGMAVAMRARRGGGPNMTAMVDVVMCILIFFMLASTFLKEWMLKNALTVGKGPGTEAATGKLPAVKSWIRMERRGGETWVKAFDGEA